MRVSLFASYAVGALLISCSRTDGARTGTSRTVGGGADASSYSMDVSGSAGGPAGLEASSGDSGTHRDRSGNAGGSEAGLGDSGVQPRDGASRDASTGDEDGAAHADVDAEPTEWACTDEPVASPTPLADSVVRDFIDALCGYMDRCYPGYLPSEDLCRELYLCSRGSLGIAGITEAQLSSCARQIATTTDCPVSPWPPHCDLSVETAGEGERCNTVPCAEGLYCRYSTPEACPVCTPVQPLDGSCANTYECASNQYCNPETSACELLGRPGDPCSTDSACGYGRCVDGTCRAPRSLGETCSDSAECGSGLTCSGGSCVLTLARPGDPCDALTPCLGGVCEQGACSTVCVDGELLPGRCLASTDCAPDELCDAATARCTPRPRDGETCNAGTIKCVPGQHCDATRGCVPLLGNGERCSAGAECWSTFCLRGRCAPKCACEMP